MGCPFAILLAIDPLERYISVKGCFVPHIKFIVGSVSNIIFWHDVWVGDGYLVDQFLELYTCARYRRAKVSGYMERSAAVMVWTRILRRNLLQLEETSLFSLLEILVNVSIPEDGIDNRCWVLSKGGSFLVASFAEVLSSSISYSKQLNFLCKLKAPPRMILFGWLALWGSILTMDNL